MVACIHFQRAFQPIYTISSNFSFSCIVCLVVELHSVWLSSYIHCISSSKLHVGASDVAMWRGLGENLANLDLHGHAHVHHHWANETNKHIKGKCCQVHFISCKFPESSCNSSWKHSMQIYGSERPPSIWKTLKQIYGKHPNKYMENTQTNIWKTLKQIYGKQPIKMYERGRRAKFLKVRSVQKLNPGIRMQ